MCVAGEGGVRKGVREGVREGVRGLGRKVRGRGSEKRRGERGM